jgi:hypothetical protein
MKTQSKLQRGSCCAAIARRDMADDQRFICGKPALLRKVTGHAFSIEVFLCHSHTQRADLRNCVIERVHSMDGAKAVDSVIIA